MVTCWSFAIIVLSSQMHIHYSLLLCLIVIWLDFFIVLLMALSPTAPIVSKLLVLYHRHYCYSHSYFRHKDYCTMHPTVLCSINTESLWYMLWSTISFWLCSRQVAYLSHYLNNTISFWLCSSLCITPTTASSGYGSCPQGLNQDFNHTCIFQMWVSLSSLLTVGGDEAAVGVMCRLEHSQKEIVIK